jgi:hypothetical protein
MPLPPLLLSRSLPAQIALAIVLPIAYGLLTGYVLGTSETLYLILSILGIVGGLGAGFDHASTDEGFIRGILGGLQFGVAILVAHSISGDVAKASLPHPHIILPIITVILGALFGALGASLRARAERRRAAATPAAV